MDPVSPDRVVTPLASAAAIMYKAVGYDMSLPPEAFGFFLGNDIPIFFLTDFKTDPLLRFD